MAIWLQATLWGLLAGSTFLIGAGLGYFVRIPDRIVAGIMAFGSGVLISALYFELVEEAYEQGGFDATAIGFMAGAVIYSGANWILAPKGAKHRKRSNGTQPSEQEDASSGMALTIGALIDGIPESIVIGLGLIGGGKVSMVTVIAIFLFNSSQRSFQRSRHEKSQPFCYVFLLWGSIATASGIASWLGYSFFSGYSLYVLAGITAIAAGAILTMLVDTKIPEAFEKVYNFTGLIMVAGFLTAYLLSKMESGGNDSQTVAFWTEVFKRYL